MSHQSLGSFDFSGKRALVTGAGRGIGRAIAKALSESGAETFALSKTEENLKSLVDENPSIHPICVDLSDWEATRKAVDGIGRVDFLVNNAMVGFFKSFLETDESDLNRTFDVNFKAAVNVSQIVAKKLIDEGCPGSIVNLSSVLSKIPLTFAGAYCCSKGALDQLTRVMANELGPHKIRVNSVHPTAVPTETGMALINAHEFFDPLKARTPLAGVKYAEISEVVGPVLFLLSDQASMIHGSFLPIDGGLLAN
jgi:L-xylulose reductase